MKQVMLHVSALLVGLVPVDVVQFLIVQLWGALEIAWGSGNHPVAGQQMFAMLLTTFLAGTAGPIQIAAGGFIGCTLLLRRTRESNIA